MDKIIKDWQDNLSNEEWNDLLKKYDHYGHDIGINETELIDMYNNEMTQKKHYYLIDSKIMKSSSKMPPTTIAVNEEHGKAQALKYHYQELYSRWKCNLQTCQISESELDNVKNNIIDYWFHESNPIEVTRIVEEVKEICEPCNCNSYVKSCEFAKYTVKFKDSKKVESEEIDDIEKLEGCEYLHHDDDGIHIWYRMKDGDGYRDIKATKKHGQNLHTDIDTINRDKMHDLKLDILQILQEEATTKYNPEGKDSRVIYSDEFETIANKIINLFKMQK
jgi:hypothetical protein